MNVHCLVAVLVTLVLIDVGDGQRPYPTYNRYNQYGRGQNRYNEYGRGQLGVFGYNRGHTIVDICLGSPDVYNMLTKYGCPKPTPDPCTGIDCNCKGKCSEGKCKCIPGFTGEFCSETLPDIECNGGHLVEVDGKFKCECPSGMFGPDCSIECKNGGTLVEVNGVFKCDCPLGKFGPDCSIECKNGGTFVEVDGKLKCDCPFGAFGPDCIPTLVCQNGGTLTESKGVFKCICPVGGFGNDCSLGYCDLTHTVICKNGGTCIPNERIDRSPSCKCKPGFSGKFCKLKVPTLVCQNGGTLSSRKGVPYCSCPHGTFGDDCSLGFCDIGKVYCHNGGTCIPSFIIGGSPSCKCPPGTIPPSCKYLNP